MEFHEKLQVLRKQRGLTQEELASLLFVSRTAVSKWESGRGYPNIDSLKAISAFFSITMDDLLSGAELLTMAEADIRRNEKRLRDRVFGLLDGSAAALFLLPFFRQTADGSIRAVSLLQLRGISPWMKGAYAVAALGMIAAAMLTLVLPNSCRPFWERNSQKISLGINAIAALLMMISLQPYAAAWLFVCLMIKGFMLVKWP